MNNKWLHAEFPFWFAKIPWFYVVKMTYYVNFHPSVLHAKWFAFQWQIPIEPQLRHLDLKLEFQMGVNHSRLLLLTVSQHLSSSDDCICSRPVLGRSLLLLGVCVTSDTIQFLLHLTCRFASPGDQQKCPHITNLSLLFFSRSRSEYFVLFVADRLHTHTHTEATNLQST